MSRKLDTKGGEVNPSETRALLRPCGTDCKDPWHKMETAHQEGEPFFGACPAAQPHGVRVLVIEDRPSAAMVDRAARSIAGGLDPLAIEREMARRALKAALDEPQRGVKAGDGSH